LVKSILYVLAQQRLIDASIGFFHICFTVLVGNTIVVTTSILSTAEMPIYKLSMECIKVQLLGRAMCGNQCRVAINIYDCDVAHKNILKKLRASGNVCSYQYTRNRGRRYYDGLQLILISLLS